ncbi:MAG: DUF4249 family protein [Bacteroidia bacterium]
MKIQFQILLVLFISFTLASCLPEALPTDVEQAESKLVISSQIIPNNIMVITVSRSFSALEGNQNQDDIDQYLVKNAIVVMTYNGTTDTFLSREDAPGLYFSTFRLEKENEQFNLSVFDPKTNETVTSTSTMLPRINLETVQIEAKPTQSLLDTVYNLTASFTDASINNWYVLNIINPNEVGNESVFSLDGQTTTYSILVSDKLYNTNRIEIQEEIVGYNMPDTALVMFSNISEDYFRYLDARRRGGSILASLTGEPVNHPSNVVGGYGYFNTHNPSLIQVIVKK